jgi:hypothetical protein
VDMSGAAGVVTREDGLELHDAVGVGLLQTAQEGGVEVCLVVGVTVAVGDDAGVDTLCLVSCVCWDGGGGGCVR